MYVANTQLNNIRCLTETNYPLTILYMLALQSLTQKSIHRCVFILTYVFILT